MGDEKVSYRKRLVLGEADFSYSQSLTNKHAGKGGAFFSSITATELETEDKLKLNYENFVANVKVLHEKNVTIQFGVNATQIDSVYAGQPFKRIHFNCPHDKSSFIKQTLPPIIAKFFLSASAIQKCGDRIHMALPKNSNFQSELFRQSYIYQIYDAATKAGYILLNKHKFGTDRYPGYQHRITGIDDSAGIADELREYVFIKTNKSSNEIEGISPYIPKVVRDYAKTKLSSYVVRKALPQIETDDESSDYEDKSVDNADDFNSFLAVNANKDLEYFASNYGHILTLQEIQAHFSTKAKMKVFFDNAALENICTKRLVEMAQIYGSEEYDSNIEDILIPVISLLAMRQSQLLFQDIMDCCCTPRLMGVFIENAALETMEAGRLNAIAELYLDSEYSDDINKIVAPVIDVLQKLGDDSMALQYGLKQAEFLGLEAELQKMGFGL